MQRDTQFVATAFFLCATATSILSFILEFQSCYFPVYQWEIPLCPLQMHLSLTAVFSTFCLFATNWNENLPQNDHGMDYQAFGKTANKSSVFQNISLSELIQLQIFHLNKVKIKLKSYIM